MCIGLGVLMNHAKEAKDSPISNPCKLTLFSCKKRTWKMTHIVLGPLHWGWNLPKLATLWKCIKNMNLCMMVSNESGREYAFHSKKKNQSWCRHVLETIEIKPSSSRTRCINGIAVCGFIEGLTKTILATYCCEGSLKCTGWVVIVNIKVVIVMMGSAKVTSLEHKSEILSRKYELASGKWYRTAT